jgi:ABC-type multidrug transport system ATPase subunit
MDEITVDMDVLGRMDLLEFFRQECEERGATIIYATHIFDGLENWITHIAYLEDGQLVKGECDVDTVIACVGCCCCVGACAWRLQQQNLQLQGIVRW